MAEPGALPLPEGEGRGEGEERAGLGPCSKRDLRALREARDERCPPLRSQKFASQELEVVPGGDGFACCTTHQFRRQPPLALLVDSSAQPVEQACITAGAQFATQSGQV